MIKSLKITNLFGAFNYDIQFRDEGITIITGPNGFGKSTILNIIETIAEKDLYELCQFSFERITVITTNEKIEIEKRENGVVVNDCYLEFFSQRIMDNWRRRKGLPFIERIGPETFLDVRYDRVITLKEYAALVKQYNSENDIVDKLISVNYEHAKQNKKDSTKYKILQRQVALFKQDVGKIKFIKEQRLIRQVIEEESYYSRSDKPRIVEVITELPKKMMDQIKDVVLKYSEIASQLDSSFPARLFESEETISIDEYVNSLVKIVKRQEKIQDYSLIKDLRIISIGNYKEAYAKALKVYLDDTTQKLAVYNELINKLDAFVYTINGKLYNKRIVVSSDFGLKVVRHDGRELDLNKLSSGEQQIIVLYYELIFETQDKTILMIDEPEISLHVAWQRTIMEDLKKILSLKNGELYVIVATHSPQVINNNWGMIVDLGEGEENEQFNKN